MSTPAGAAGVEGRWERRPRIAIVLRSVMFLGPVIVATDISLILGRFLPTPHSITGYVAWWAVVLAGSGVALVVFDRLFRRLLPLVVLLDLALVFPGVAPPRFTAAFRAGTVRNLQGRIDRAKSDADGADMVQAAATVVELIAALAVHDPRTRGHSERTRAYSELVAEELGLLKADRDRLRWSSLLHDIGKLHVTAAVLNKPGRPDPDEWEVLKRHPAEGAKIAGALRHWLGPWGLAIEQHHEKFDGTGYPNGLAGDEISLGGRIVAVADAYEVMTSVRSYTPPVPPAAAREELVRCSGGHFDPEIVRAFLRIGIAKFPKRAGILIALAQLPGFLGAAQILQQAGSALAAGAGVVALAVGGIVVPGGPGLGGIAPSDVGPAAADGGPIGSRDGASTKHPSRSTTTTLVGGLLGDTVASAAPSTVPTSEAIAAPPAPTTAPPAPVPLSSGFLLAGTAPGQPASPAELQQAGQPAGAGAPDYDGDGAPGKTLLPSPRPASTTTPEEHQLWVARPGGAVHVSGTPTLTISSAVAGFARGRGTLRAFLLDCDGAGGSCRSKAITTATLSETDWSGGLSGFSAKTLMFSKATYDLSGGRTLVLRLGVPSGSDPLLIAYGTPEHPARLVVALS